MWCLHCIGVTSNTVPRTIFCQGSGREENLIRTAYVTSSCLRQFPLSSSIIENIPRHHKIISNLLYIVNQKDLGNNPKQKQYYFLPKGDNPNRKKFHKQAEKYFTFPPPTPTSPYEIVINRIFYNSLKQQGKKNVSHYS